MWFSSPPVGALLTQDARNLTSHLPMWPALRQENVPAPCGRAEAAVGTLGSAMAGRRLELEAGS